MKDSILKGTGNSRFLKSAVPAGTSWADALAMLQAGTFPIDFNGINTEGFQQVGTPLNKANLLKDVNALTLGLPGTAVPDDMFNVLAHAGDLHVWKKTVFEPAGYHLGTTEKGFIVSATAYNSGNVIVSFTTSDTISVDSNGVVTQDSPSGDQFFVVSPGNVAAIQAKIRGKFVTEKTTVASGYYAEHHGLVYIPEDAILSCITNGVSLGYPYAYCYVVDKMQVVQSYPVNPVATYPVSTNRNAYQEGDDAKPAGYTLGNAGRIVFYSGNDRLGFKYGDAITVSDDGKTIDIKNPSYQEWYGSNINNVTVMSGKFVRFTFHDNTDYGTSNPVYFMPSTSKMEYDSDANVSAVVQPVTGYAAIPANATIEYLGCLGDKVRVQVVSYVGTGTYGSDHPNSLTFDFAPKIIQLVGSQSSGGVISNVDTVYSNIVIPWSALKTEYAQGIVLGNRSSGYGKKSDNNHSFIWYSSTPDNQLNSPGVRYYVLAIG